MRRFGLIGFPLSHSFSQKYFTEKFERLGLTDCVYENFQIESIDELSEIVKKYPDICGLNVTIPYKQLVFRYLDSTNTIPEGICACNCIKITDGKLIGYNTDIIGFEQSLLPFLKPYHTKALVLGNGGAAEAVKFVLKKNGISPESVSRELHNGSSFTYSELNRELIQDHLLVINTTPMGMYPKVEDCADIPYQYLTPQHHLYDLVYNPAETKFLEKGRLQGATTQNGYEMLVLQAEESWRIWNNQ